MRGVSGTEAFGKPGIEPRWRYSDKEGAGTAYSVSSHLWFTIWNGIVAEVYYSNADRPHLHDLQSLITHAWFMTARDAFKCHWRLYVFEGMELAIFMISACFATVCLFDPSYPALHLIPSAAIRRLLMGIAMGATAVLIIHSPMGKRSGAHFNPAISLSYLRLGKIARWDAIFYVVFQFIGAVFGVAVSALVLGSSLAAPTTDYAVTIPGRYGTAAAFFAELFMSTFLMGAVLWFSNRPSLANYTGYMVGILISLYVLFFAPVSGFSVNPARTTGSAVFANVWTACWLYFAAPLLGMMGASELYLRIFGPAGIFCAKLHPDPAYPCPFFCHYPLHRHRIEPVAEG